MRSASLSRARAAGSSRRWRSGLRSRSWPSRSPPGRAVVDSVRKAIGIESAEQALFSLPAPGRLLVVSDSGRGRSARTAPRDAWATTAKRPAPRSAASSALRAERARRARAGRRSPVEAPRPDVRAPRWGGTATDTRIAYLSGGLIRVVAGDSTGDRALMRRARRRGFPARSACSPWRVRAGSRSSTPSGDKPGGRRVAADSLVWSADGTRLLALRGGRYTVLSPAGEVPTTGEASDAALLRAAMPLPSCAARRRAASSPSAVACASRGRAPSATRPGRPTAAGSLFLARRRPARLRPRRPDRGGSRPRPTSRPSSSASSPRVAGWCPASQP